MSSLTKEIAHQAEQLLRDIFAGSAAFLEGKPDSAVFILTSLVTEVHAIHRLASSLAVIPVVHFSGKERAQARAHLSQDTALAGLRVASVITRPTWAGWWEHSQQLFYELARELDAPVTP